MIEKDQGAVVVVEGVALAKIKLTPLVDCCKYYNIHLVILFVL